jgi:hypothetical protein
MPSFDDTFLNECAKFERQNWRSYSMFGRRTLSDGQKSVSPIKAIFVNDEKVFTFDEPFDAKCKLRRYLTHQSIIIYQSYDLIIIYTLTYMLYVYLRRYLLI